MWLPLLEAFIEVWLPCGYAWLPILNPYRKSVATRVIKEKSFKQVTIYLLHLRLSYIKCGYLVATIVGGLALLKRGYRVATRGYQYKIRIEKVWLPESIRKKILSK